MRILGIDPGLATIGLGLVEAASPHDIRVCEWLTLETEAGTAFDERLGEIHSDLSAYIRQMKPDTAVVEKLFFATNARTAFDVAQARGVIILTLSQSAVPLMEPTPLQLKSCITGDGKAAKSQMQAMLVRMLRLRETPKPDDAADALALAVYGALQSSSIAVEMLRNR